MDRRWPAEGESPPAALAGSGNKVARFRDTYCLAQEACQILAISRSTLARWEGAGKIRAIYSRKQHAGAGASVFLRAEIESLRIRHKAA